MDLLILGGTKFLGPHLVDAAVASGHRVTLFNRGLAGSAPPGVDFVQGDRRKDLARLEGRHWDGVIDTCAFVPRAVTDAVKALRDVIKRYVLVSSISVYAEPLRAPFDETQPTIELPDPSVEEVTNESYGGLKALCERELLAALPDRALVVRPGLIVGPLDPTDRFTYWPHRFAQGGDVLVPGSPSAFVSFIDVRDLAAWIVRAVEQGVMGTFNAAGVYGTTTMGDVIEACRAASGAASRSIWLDEAFVISRGVAPWTELPLWIPADEGSLLKASSERAVGAGLVSRPLEDTVLATMEWTKTLGLERPLRAGLTRERERELLAEWAQLREGARS